MIKEIHGVLEDKAILEAGIEGHKIITEVNMNSLICWKEEEEESRARGGRRGGSRLVKLLTRGRLANTKARHLRRRGEFSCIRELLI